MYRRVRIIGVPADYGANRRGVDMGPSAIRYAGLEDKLVANEIECSDEGNVDAPPMETESPGSEETVKIQNWQKIEHVCKNVYERVDTVFSTETNRALPLVLGGDHSVAIGSLSASAEDTDLGVLWFDAHADFNTKMTSPTQNFHGMALAAALEHRGFADEPWVGADGLDPENVAIVGLRAVDTQERPDFEDSDVRAWWMDDIERDGITDVVEEAYKVASDGVDGIHLSLDMDWLDPAVAPGVGAPVRGGSTYREARAALERVAECDQDDKLLRSMDIVEVNPILDDENETAELAVDLTTRALTNPDDPVSEPGDRGDSVKWPGDPHYT